MSELYKTAMSLRFFGDELDPEEITRLLGKAPTASERKGEIIKNKKTGRERKARRGQWRHSVERKTPGDINAQIAEILQDMTDDLNIWNELATRYKADFFCGLFMKEENEGIDISSKMMKMLGERGLLLNLDIYCPGPD